MFIIAGLGNPGSTYADTRHNAGFMALELLSRLSRIEVGGFRFKARTGAGIYRGHELFLLKPRTYMNLSGESILPCLRSLKLGPESLIVIHDDLDLAQGRVHIKAKGGDGGHRGLRSIIDSIGAGDFARVRIGIGRPPAEIDAVDYVLESLAPDEKENLKPALNRAAQAALAIALEGVVIAMNRFNREPRVKPEEEKKDLTAEITKDAEEKKE